MKGAEVEVYVNGKDKASRGTKIENERRRVQGEVERTPRLKRGRGMERKVGKKGGGR